MIEMEPNKIYTIRCRRPLTREERRRRIRIGISIICAVIALIIGIIIGYLYGRPGTARASEAQQVTGKLDPPVIARVALLTPVETAPTEQVTAPRYDVPLTDDELDALLEACDAGHIDPEIALGLIQVESSFRPDALNPRSGCYGYLQLNPQYFPSALPPVDNIRTGIEYLAYQLGRYDGDLEAALTAYNAGYDTGDRTYAAKVMEAAESFKVEVSK